MHLGPSSPILESDLNISRMHSCRAKPKSVKYGRISYTQRAPTEIDFESNHEQYLIATTQSKCHG